MKTSIFWDIVSLVSLVSLGGVRLSPLGTSATVGLLYQPRMIDVDDYGAVGGMRIGRGNRSTRRKPAPVPPCPPQIPHDLTWDRTRDAAVGILGYNDVYPVESQLTLLFLAGFLLGLLFAPEVECDMFFRNVSWLSMGYMALLFINSNHDRHFIIILLMSSKFTPVTILYSKSRACWRSRRRKYCIPDEHGWIVYKTQIKLYYHSENRWVLSVVLWICTFSFHWIFF
jgi:hypothetical protein